MKNTKWNAEIIRKVKQLHKKKQIQQKYVGIQSYEAKAISFSY